MKIALCLIATGKYTRFLPDLQSSAVDFFCSRHNVEFFVFTDSQFHSTSHPRSIVVPTPHEPWPGPTLHRYHALLRAERELLACDYVFYCDVDMLFVAPVGDEILGPGLTATLHPGFADKPRTAFTYESRSSSEACIRPDEGSSYYCGGFQGGRSRDYMHAAARMAAAIDCDSDRGVTAVWHDESHWNRYLIDHPPATILSPLYCSPQPWNVPGRKLIALEKNHAEVRA